MSGSFGRIAAMVLRYWYLLRASWPRLLELIYWPTMNMLVMGLLQFYLADDKSSLVELSGALIGAVMLWDVLFRGQLAFTFTFVEEVWSRNIANLLMSPLKPAELAAAMMLMSLIRLLIGMAPVTILALLLFGFNVYGLGPILIVLFANLVITGWAVGLVVTGLILRNGLGAESLAWSVMILLLPVVCVYYPVWVLPDWLQPVAWSLPPTYVFEGMRAALIDGAARTDLMLQCLALNGIYLTAGFGSFLLLVKSARHKGRLLTLGE